MLLTETKEVSYVEKRKLSKLPDFKWNNYDLNNYPKRFENFINDQFGFRERLIQMYYMLNYNLDPMSSTEYVIVGKNGWLFWNGEDIIEDYRNSRPLTSKELEKIKKYLETKYYWLKEQDINYLFVITPNKHTIYGENIPSNIRKVNNKSRYDQIIEYIGAHSEVPLIDLRPVLLKAKKNAQLYYKNDTHWNVIGANYAQHEIAEYLSTLYPAIKPKLHPLDSFEFNIGHGGDLVEMMNLGKITEEVIPYLNTEGTRCKKIDLDKKLYNLEDSNPLFMTDCPTNHGINALIFRDSSFEQLQPYISEYFSKATYVWIRLPDLGTLKETVLKTRPNIVIDQIAEFTIKDSINEIVFYTSDMTGKEIAVGGDVHLDTTHKKYGLASLRFDGNKDIMRIADHQGWAFGSEDFTVDFWVRFASTFGTQVLVGSPYYIPDKSWQIAWEKKFKCLRFSFSTDGNDNTDIRFHWSPSDGIWYHLAIVRKGSDLRAFVDGVQLGENYNIGNVSIFDSKASIYIGSRGYEEHFNGWLDEIRISKGIARWTSHFTSPSKEYSTDPYTKLLLHGNDPDKW